jgi:PAS domain S-box-containing protein
MPKHEAGSKKPGSLSRKASLERRLPATKAGGGIRADSFPPSGEERAFRRAVEEAVISGIAAFDAEGRQTYANPAFCKLVGWPPEQLLGKEPPFAYWPAEEKETNLTAFRKILGGGKPRGALELSFQRHNGECFDALILYSAMQDEEGNRKGWVMSVGDFTPHKRAEADMGKRIARMASFPELNPNPVMEIDWAGQVFYLNPAAQRLFPDLEHLGPRHPFLAELESVIPIFRDGKGDSHARDIRVGPSWYHQTFYSPPESNRLRIYAYENTEQKEALRKVEDSERKYRALYEGSRDGYANTDMNGTIREFNTAFKEMLGYTEEELRKLSYRDLTPSEWHDREAGIIENEVLTRGYSKVYEKEYRRKDGTIFPVSLRTYLAKDGQGNPTGIWAFVRDVTQRKKMEEDLGRNRDRFALLSETAGRLLESEKPQEIMEDLCRKVMAHLECHSCFHHLVDEEKQRLRLNAYAGIPAEEARKIEWLNFGEAACGCAARDGERTVMEHIPETPDPRADFLHSCGLKAYASHPLLSQGKVIGTLSFGTRSRPAFSEDDLSLMKTVAAQVSLALERLRLLETARRRADELDAVFSAISEPLIIYDSAGIPVKFNPAVASVYGFDPAEVGAKSPEILVSLFRRLEARFPDGAPVRVDQLPSRRALRGEAVSKERLLFKNALGEEITILASASPLFSDGKINGAVTVWTDITEREQLLHRVERSRDELDVRVKERTHDLAKRLKETNCLYAVSGMLNKENASLEEDLHQVVAAIPAGWQFPEIACARVVLDGREFKTGNFRETPLAQASAIFAHGKQVGILEVGYLEGRPARDEGPFLNEERTLLDALAGQIGEYVERQRAEDALRRSVLYTRSLIEASLDPLVTISPEGKITDVNRATEFATGVPRGKLIGSDFSDYFTDPAEARVGYEQAFRQGSVRDYPLAIRHASGRVTDVLYNATVYRNEAGEIRGVCSAARDITRRKAMEQELLRLAAAVEQISEGILITDRDGKILYLNEAFESHHGLNRKEAMGSSYLDLLRAGMDDETKGAFTPEYTLGSKGWKGRLTKQPKEGRGGELEITITPVFGPSGEVINYVAVERDLTQELKLQEHLRQRHKMEALGTLAGGIAHDFNNILMPIVINTEMALLDLKQEVLPSLHSLQLVREAANRGQELVKQIITYSRQKEQPRSPVEILPVVKEALKFLRATIPTNIEIRPAIGVESAVISADPTQVHQVLMNLCNNAAYAMREEGGVLEVDLAKVEVTPETADRHEDMKPGPFLRLTVKDNGQGMTREVREKAFDPFFTTKRPSEGTGMGLAVVHGIVKTHEGAITLESEVGKGTVVRVYLPAAQQAGKDESLPSDPLLGGNERILYIDDEEIQVRSLQHMLERLGYRITGKTDPREALEAFRKEPDAFDLVITDQTMPDLTGAQLAREFLRLRPDLPIILTTGFSETIDEEGARALGVRDFALKPLNMRDLTERIRRALKK